MKKLILFLFVALLTQVFTSCKDDDVYHITDTDLNGVYLGTMDVDAPFGGVQLGADDIKQKIYYLNPLHAQSSCFFSGIILSERGKRGNIKPAQNYVNLAFLKRIG